MEGNCRRKARTAYEKLPPYGRDVTSWGGRVSVWCCRGDMQSSPRAEAHDDMLPVPLDEMRAPLTGIHEDEDIDGEGNHLLEAKVEFFEGDGVDVVVRDTQMSTWRRRWR